MRHKERGFANLMIEVNKKVTGYSVINQFFLAKLGVIKLLFRALELLF